MKRSSLLLGVTVSLLSLSAFAAAPKDAPAAGDKPAAAAPAKKAKKAPKHVETKKPAATDATH
jgi:hypothetical protein